MKYEVIACIALIGCADRAATTFAFYGPDSDYASAVSAAEQWNGCDLYHIDVYPADTAPRDAVPIRYVQIVDPEHPLWHGITHRTNGSVDYIVYDSTDPDYTVTNLAHEFGHALTLPHYGSGLMNGNYTVAGQHVEPDDCKRLQETEQ